MRIFCGNLKWTLGDDDLRAAFEEHGVVSDVKIMIDPETGHSRGFGFIGMPSEDDGLRAITALDGADLKGRPLRCSRAYDWPRRPRSSNNITQGE